ncbi:GNAT family N-acetyltransferase [Nocardia bovistercoris]|uniref:GNAT family N-acetyltransferase n=1 Tax=Nocardia bovistercoris TaxID=2785916 RepID=A0A931IIZ7_9NOCA|nr:GNAT family N-acetyltransferase [Nocardia bovistercoris]MBH0780550.1 GNAT family N-acetyltransferase [Nocardia bovistercoris]
MTLVPGITIRTATEDDAAGIGLLLSTSFGFGYEPPGADPREPVFPKGGKLVALDGQRIVGHTNSMTMTLTVSSGRTVEACGISGVGVAPTHRRRGILRAMYIEQHRRIEAEALPLTIFTASRATIYSRFGYGPATVLDQVVIDRRFAEFHADAPDPGGVSVEAPGDVGAEIERIYDRWRRGTPGAQARPKSGWAELFFDHSAWRGGGSSLFALLHADGYALYRYQPREGRRIDVRVVEFRAVTDDAHAALWRALLGLDLVTEIEAELTDNDPLPYLLTDCRLVRTRGRYDGCWLRVMDVPAALTARDYARDLEVVLGVTDPFRAAGGAFALTVRGGAAECVPTDREPEVTLDIDVLGSLYLGAHRAEPFAAAGRLRAKSAEPVRALTEAFASARDPELGWFF